MLSGTKSAVVALGLVWGRGELWWWWMGTPGQSPWLFRLVLFPTANRGVAAWSIISLLLFLLLAEGHGA